MECEYIMHKFFVTHLVYIVKFTLVVKIKLNIKSQKYNYYLIRKGKSMTNEWKIILVGDVVFQEDLKKSFLTEEMKKIVRDHDISSCHFEAQLYPDKNLKMGGYLWLNHKSSNYPKEDKLAIRKAFSPFIYQHPKAAEWVKDAGFNVINLASNHLYDYGQKALEYTLDSFPAQVKVGAGRDFESAYKLKIVEVKGTKVGFLSYCESEFGALVEENTKRGGFAWINHPSVNDRIKDAKTKVDVLIIQAHAGPEKTYLPIYEWRKRYQEFIDLGADAVIAHHPHVPQGWELYNNKAIFYSIGNFFFDTENKEKYWNYGMAVSLTFTGNKFEKLEVIPTKRTDEGTGVCKEKSYLEHLDNLCGMLKPECYPKLADELCLKLWKEQYSYIYAQTINIFPCTGIWNICWKICGKILSKLDLVDKLSLLHNIRIESHLWTTKRALALMEEKYLMDNKTP